MLKNHVAGVIGIKKQASADRSVGRSRRDKNVLVGSIKLQLCYLLATPDRPNLLGPPFSSSNTKIWSICIRCSWYSVVKSLNSFFFFTRYARHPAVVRSTAKHVNNLRQRQRQRHHLQYPHNKTTRRIKPSRNLSD